MISVHRLIDSSPRWLLSSAISVAGLRYRLSRFNKDFYRRLEEFRALERMDRDVLRAQQLEKLKSTVAIAYGQSEYYRQRMDESGIKPEDIRSLDDLGSLPILERRDILDNFDRMLTRPIDSTMIKHHSSGTTGQRLEFVLPKSVRWTDNFAALYQAYSWHGIAPFDRRVTLGARYMGKNSDGAIFRNVFEHQLLLGIHAITEKNVHRYMRELTAFKPKFMHGHPSAIGLLAMYANKANIPIPKIDNIAVTGETLTEEHREFLAESFDANVFASYGMGESCVMTAECEQKNGYHIHPAFGLVEKVDFQDDYSEIVLTSLNNPVMPLIRYRPGDLVESISEEPCECGRTWPRVFGLQGRNSDILTTAAGKVVLPLQLRTDLRYRFLDLPPYSIVQKRERGKYELILYTKTDAPVGCDVEAVCHYLSELFGSGSVVTSIVKPVGDMLTLGGKHKMIIKE